MIRGGRNQPDEIKEKIKTESEKTEKSVIDYK